VDLETGTEAGRLANYYFPTTLTEWALFGDLTVNFSDRFSLQLGGRGSHNKQHYSEVDSGPLIPLFYGMPSPVVIPPQDTTGTAFTYLVTPQWKLSPDTMIYARFTSGYRLGGNNIEATVGQIPPTYDPDKTTNYEVGIKGDLFDGRLSYDAAAYYTNWKNIQIYLYSPITFSGYNDNAGTARTQGLELSLQVAGALSNGFLVEWIDWVPEDLFAEMPVMQGGDFLIPDRPGHGVALAPGAETKYRVG
jgi:outer membrane receptor protein involved in Fe transport